MTPLVITKEKFMEWFDKNSQVFQDMELAGTNDNIMPKLFVHTMDTTTFAEGITVFALAMDCDSDEEKATTMRMVGKKLYEDKVLPIAVFSVHEAWAVLGMEAGKWDGTRPRDCPDRCEVVMITGTDFTRQHAAMEIIRILKDRDHKMTAGGPPQRFVDDGGAHRIDCRLLYYIFDGFKEAALADGNNPFL